LAAPENLLVFRDFLSEQFRLELFIEVEHALLFIWDG